MDLKALVEQAEAGCGVPVGAAIVRDGKQIRECFNQPLEATYVATETPAHTPFTNQYIVEGARSRTLETVSRYLQYRNVPKALVTHEDLVELGNELRREFYSM